MINEYFVFIGVAAASIGGFSYFLDTIKGKIKPNKVSWLLWAVAPLLAFFAEASQGVGIQSLTTFIVGFVPLVVFLGSFVNKKAYWNLTKLDIACGVLSCLGLLLWYVSRQGNIAILFAILADFIAAFPTIVKSWNNPESESASVFIGSLINALIGLLVIKTWDFKYYAFPLYLVFICALIACLISFRPVKKLKTLIK